MKPTLVVLAAGMGSRYGGVKQIDAVGLHGETLLDFATFDAKKCGYGKVVYIIREDIEKDFRERLFDRVARNMNAEYVFQTPDSLLSEAQQKTAKAAGRTKPWGTIHALLCARDAVNTPFTVINADDYYGRAAFETLGAYLAGIGNDSTEHAMVGYVLGNTMSKSGTVSRGVCVVRRTGHGDELVSMEEQTKIGYEGDKIASIIGDKKVILTGKEWVSMNFFGFAPTAFTEFTAYWEAFIAENAGREKPECLLPNGVSKIVADGKGKIKFFTSTENWFGMTYPEDRAVVKAEIAGKIESGYYPAELWK